MTGHGLSRQLRLPVVLVFALTIAACTGSDSAATPDASPTTSSGAIPIEINGTSFPGAPLLNPAATAAPVVDSALAAWATDVCTLFSQWAAQPDPFDFRGSASSEMADQQAFVAGAIPSAIEFNRDIVAHLNAIAPPPLAAEYHNALRDVVAAVADDYVAALPAVEAAQDLQEFAAVLDRAEATEIALETLASVATAVDPSVSDALTNEPLCATPEPQRNPERTSIRTANVSDEIEQSLPAVADMVPANWRWAAFDYSDLLLVGRATDIACPADLPTIAQLGGPLGATWTIDPVDWGARFLFNGAIGAHGSQLWAEVWTFESSEIAAASYQNTTDVLTTAPNPGCSLDGDDIQRGALVTPNFELPDSISYASDTTAADVDTHLEVYIVQRGRYIGMLIFFDHAPYDLWEHDGERVLKQFEERLSAAP